MRLDHINISAPLEVLEKEKAFFCKVLDLEVGPRPDFSRFGYWLYADGMALVHLTKSDNHFAYDKKPYLDHVAFQMEGLNAFVAHLQSLEVGFRTSFQKELAITQVFLTSPAGVGLEVSFKNETLTQAFEETTDEQ